MRVTSRGIVVNGEAKIYDGKKHIKTIKIERNTANTRFTLKKGTHQLKVVFSGNSIIAGSTSQTLTVRVR